MIGAALASFGTRAELMFLCAVTVCWNSLSAVDGVQGPAGSPAFTSDSSVASLPCAFCTLNCEDVRPAAVSAWVRYGASNWTYRAEVTVSGRMTATLPLPAEARGFRADIAVKLRSNWPTEIDTD